MSATLLGMRKYLALAVIPLLVSCGSAKADSEAGTAKPVAIEDLAQLASCDGFKQDPEVMGVREAGSCRYAGSDMSLYTYADDAQQGAMHDLSRSGGGVWIVGPLWDIQAASVDVADEIAARTGGAVE
jgi:hypothetical protein